jgi:HAD superfamily hydrolase (TIGR01450 family)
MRVQTDTLTMQAATLEELIGRYAVLLFDAYGVLVHASGALPGAAELIDRLNRQGKPYYILTNDASRLPETAAAMLRGYGLAVPSERIITSGALLANHFAARGLAGSRCVVLGSEDSVRFVEQAGGRVVPPADDFDVLVICDETGFPFLETADLLLGALYRKFDRREAVHLLLPNPDLIYPKADRGFGFAAGSVALIFEAALRLRYPDREALGFERLGKPHAAIFEEALRRGGSRDMLMFGDQLETDIRGANGFGIPSVLVGTGVNGAGATGIPAPLRPTFRLASLRRSG